MTVAVSPRQILLATRHDVLERAEGQCHYCWLTFLDKHLVIDHVRPVARGGTGEPGNLVAACWTCNADKSDALLGEWEIAPMFFGACCSRHLDCGLPGIAVAAVTLWPSMPAPHWIAALEQEAR
jgi:hypothetical protein